MHEHSHRSVACIPEAVLIASLACELIAYTFVRACVRGSTGVEIDRRNAFIDGRDRRANRIYRRT